jgi:small nuclear ribonucleoprotein G
MSTRTLTVFSVPTTSYSILPSPPPLTVPTMSKAPTPELKKYMEKRLAVELKGSRKVSGVLRGYDPFMNIVLDNTVEEVDGTGTPIGMVVS